MTKHLYALAAEIIIALIAAFGSAIILGILNIYLAGHGITWPDEEFQWYFISMSLLDCIMLTFSFLVMICTYLIVIKVQKRNTNSE